MFTLGRFLKVTKVAHFWATSIHDEGYALVRTKNGLGNNLDKKIRTKNSDKKIFLATIWAVLLQTHLVTL
jgi:hypothetical protein